MKSIVIFCFGLFCLQNGFSQIENFPTLKDQKYGSYPEQIFDFWDANPNEKNNPVIIYFHGGAFRAGDKSMGGRQVDVLKYCLSQGISFVSANYRLSKTTRVDSILDDGRRLSQFLKFKAKELHIDITKMASYGTSAGGCMAVWLALVPKQANYNTQDTVLHFDSQIKAAAHITSPATLDITYWSSILKIDSNWMELTNYQEDFLFYKISDRSEYNNKEQIELRASLHFPNYINSNSPPLYYYNISELNPPSLQDDIAHHGLHAFYLDSISNVRNHDHVYSVNKNTLQGFQDMVDYLCLKMQACEKTSTTENSIKSKFSFNEYIEKAQNGLMENEIQIYSIDGKRIEVLNRINTVKIKETLEKLSAGFYVIKFNQDLFRFIKSWP